MGQEVYKCLVNFLHGYVRQIGNLFGCTIMNRLWIENNTNSMEKPKPTMSPTSVPTLAPTFCLIIPM